MEMRKAPVADGYAGLIRGRLEAARREGLELKSRVVSARGPGAALEPENEVLF